MRTVRVCFEPICLPPNRCELIKATMPIGSVMRSQHAQSGRVSRHVAKAVIQQDTLSDCRISATRSETLYHCCNNSIENMFGSLTDWRRLALRGDRGAHTVVSAMCLAAVVISWLSFTRSDPRAAMTAALRTVHSCAGRYHAAQDTLRHTMTHQGSAKTDAVAVHAHGQPLHHFALLRRPESSRKNTSMRATLSSDSVPTIRVRLAFSVSNFLTRHPSDAVRPPYLLLHG